MTNGLKIINAKEIIQSQKAFMLAVNHTVGICPCFELPEGKYVIFSLKGESLIFDSQGKLVRKAKKSEKLELGKEPISFKL